MDPVSHSDKLSVTLPEPPPVGDAPAASGKRPIRVRDARSARRMLSRVIDTLQGGSVAKEDRETLRLLVYALSVFTQIFRECEFEERLRQLEAAAGVQKI